MNWIQFARLEMLFLVWAVPVLLLVYVYGMKKRGRILSRFSHARGLRSIAPDTGKTRRKIKAALALAALVFISLSLAGPQYGYHWREVERKGVDIIIALDCSKSMLADDISPTRLDRAKREVYDLLTLLEGDRVGLVAFAGTAFMQCPLTLDYEAFYLFLKTLTPEYLPIGGTDLVAAIEAATGGFDETESEKAVILITDGENTGGRDPLDAAREAEKNGIKIFCIGVGSEDGVPVPDGEGGFRKNRGEIVLTKLDEETLKRTAVTTGGTYVRSVAGDMDLDAIYTNEIRAKMESATLESGRKRVWEDRYQWLLAPAILILMIEMFLPARKKSVQTLVACLAILVFQGDSVFANSAGEGLEAYEKGDYEKALELLIEAQLDDPDRPEILYNIGNAYYRKGDFESALGYYKDALNTEDTKLRQKAYYNIGNTEFRNGKPEDALKNYEEALSIDPDDEKARQNLEFVKKVIEMQKQQQDENKQCPNPDSEDGEGKEGEEQQKEGQDKEGQKQGGQQEQEGSKEQRDTGNEEREKEDPGAPQLPEEEAPEEEKQAAPAEPSENPGEEGENAQADRVLNRLKDQPGKAMIPSYRERRVEKDW